MLEGLSGAFFRPLALSYVLAIFASLVIAITLTPALSLLLLTGHRSRSKEPRLVTRIKSGYQRWLDRILHRPAIAMGNPRSRPRGARDVANRRIGDAQENEISVIAFDEQPALRKTADRKSVV